MPRTDIVLENGPGYGETARRPELDGGEQPRFDARLAGFTDKVAAGDLSSPIVQNALMINDEAPASASAVPGKPRSG